MIGQTILQYQVLEKLGEGGMGVVYKAHDTKLDRDVALKFLPPQFSASIQDKNRFVQEARAAAALNHPNVCSVIDISEHDGAMFIVMEFVDGQTLREKKNSMTLHQAIDAGIQIAEGLAAAHEKGIVHRDIKPENIMMRKDGIVQIMDFGLAKLRTSTASRLTRAGSTVGTAGYMSPEQVQGNDVDHRSDIFSLGVVLYEMFTGEMPFRGVHETALLYEIVNVDPAPMVSLKPEIDPSLDAVVLECLEKDPRERTQSAAQVALDLKRLRRESGRQKMSRITAARPASSFQPPAKTQVPGGNILSRYGAYTLSAVLSVAVIFLAFRLWNKAPGSSGSVMRFSIVLPASAPLWGAVGVSGISLSPDGNMCAYIARFSNNNQVYLHRMDRLTSEALPGADNAAEPVFSPDGQWVAFNQSNQKIVRVPVAGGAPETICRISAQTRGIAWTPDDNILFGTLSDAIMRVPASGGTPVAITVLDTSNNEISHRYPQLLPGGTWVIYTIKQNTITTFDDALIGATNLKTGERKILVHGGSFGRALPGGFLLYARGHSFYALKFDIGKCEVLSAPVLVEDGAYLFRGTGQACADFSENGTLVFAPVGPHPDFNILLGWVDLDGSSHRLFDTLRPYQSPRLSPDGGKIATGINGANNDIWVYQIARNVLTRLTFGGGNNDRPVWSPDGKYLYYGAEKSRPPNIFRKPWDGSGQEERMARSSSAQAPVSVSSDGSQLSFNEDGDVWILPLGPAKHDSDARPWPFIHSPAMEADGVFSPDGKWMAYWSDESSKKEVYVTSFPTRTGKWQVSNGGGINPIWSRDGKKLYYTNDTTLMETEIHQSGSFDFSVPRRLFTVPQYGSVQDVSPDGKRFLVMLPQSQELTFGRLDVVINWAEELRRKVNNASK